MNDIANTQAVALKALATAEKNKKKLTIGHQSEVEMPKLQKQGLMRNLLTGQVRVTAL